MDPLPPRQIIFLLYRAGATEPAPPNQSPLDRRIRIGVAQQELFRGKFERSVTPGPGCEPSVD